MTSGDVARALSTSPGYLPGGYWQRAYLDCMPGSPDLEANLRQSSGLRIRVSESDSIQPGPAADR
eukprot:7885886-Alexandrium_andersonii.AAC.1